MSSTDIGFAQNYQYANIIDITPNGDEPTWAYLAQGISTITPDPGEKIDEQEDYSTGGVTQKTVTALNPTYDVSGTRVYGNEAQDFIASLQEQTGDARNTKRRVISPDGKIVEEPITITDINMAGPNGDSSAKQAIGFKMNRQDTPQIIQQPKGLSLPTDIESEAVSVAVGESVDVVPTVSPETASDWCLYAVENTSIARVTGDGKVTGLKAGKTRLAIKCAAKPSIRVTVDVTVTAGD